MGCSDSTAMDNHLYVRNRNTLNPHVIPVETTDEFLHSSDLNMQSKNSQISMNQRRQPSYGQDLFENSQEYLDELYTICEGNLDKFFSQLQEKISEIYMTISKDTLQQMNQNVLINNESKIQISEQILWFNLNILKVASRKNEHKFNPTIFKQINKLQKNLVGYLKMKYPRGGQSFVPGDLMAVFKEFDLSEDLEFDILKNANIYFGSQYDADLSRDIKIFLNKLMNETDLNYPKFQKIMQEKVFVVEGEDGQKKTLNYKIGRKIPQNVPKYTDLDNNTLQINSPEIFRVIIKWMQYLEEILVSPNQNINKKKNFKCFIEQNDKGVNIYDEINEDQYYDLINYELIEKIQKEKTQYNDENSALLKDMDRFNSHLIKLLDTSVRRQKFVPVREMETIKYSNLNAKFIAWVLGEKVMLALKKLIKVGKSFYDTKSMLNLDLIQFKVSDLMRSMVSGSKKQILAVYANLKNLQKQGLIKIIKIKNRLGTSLNDAMIIFAMKDTFLICEIQLILSDSTQKVNQKYKNIELLNHFFYELERSPYGILSEIAVLLAYKDSKVSYEDNITFQINKIDLAECEKNHPNSVSEIKEQSKPFICTKCTKFYFKYENIFIMKHCDACNVFVCAKCIFAQDKELEKSVINRELSIQVERVVAKTLTNLRNIKSSTGASTILEMFESPFKKLEDIFGPKKVQVSKLREYLTSLIKNGIDDVYFVIVGFRTGRAVLKQLIFKPMWKEISNPFNPREQFLDKKFIFYTSYDLLLFYSPATLKDQNKQSVPDLAENMLHLYASELDLYKVFQKKAGLLIKTLKIVDFRLVIDVEKDTKKTNAQITQERQDASWKNWKNKCTKTFKYASLHQATAGLPDLAGAKSILKLSDLGIVDSHLQFFKEINWALSIKELKLSKNKLTNVAVILQVCTHIQRLSINQNFIKEIVFTKDLPMIEIINAVNNAIVKISGCQKIKNISKLLLEGNMLDEFPKSEFPNLKILSLKRNPICNFESVYKSTLPNIQQMYLDYEEENQCSYVRPNNQVDLEKVVLPFEKLRSIQSESNFTTIDIESKKIQRITFYRNELKNITLKSFENLKYVTLSENKIENVEFLFNPKYNYENNIIVQINMHKNLLTELPLMKSTSLAMANFSQNQISTLSNFTNSTLPCLKSIDLCLNRVEQLPEMSFPKLQKMLLSNNPIKAMEKLQNSKLDCLQVLDFSGCDFIQQFPLLSMPSLKEISMSSTEIENMENLSASKLPNLKKLTFSFCTIQNFPILSMQSLQQIDLTNSQILNLRNLEKCQLPNLIFLNLAYVITKDQQEDQPVDKENSFSFNLNLPKLQILKIDGANFKTIDGLQKSNLPLLNELSIQFCIFDKYPKMCLKNLKRITANNCHIKNIESILTPELSSIQAINLNNNMLQQVNLNLPKIKIVELAFNMIKELVQTGPLELLEELNLERNWMTVFPCLKAPNLKKLYVNQNSFSDIQNLKLCRLDSLEELRLKNCQLANSPFPVVNFPSIKSLYILQSELSDITNLGQSKMPIVEDINFSDNNIISMPVLKFPELKFLRFNGNQLEDILNLESSICPELTIIQFETNNLKSLPKMPFPNLTKIFTHQNNIVSVEEFNKSEFKNFLILNICQCPQLQQWPIFKNTCEQIYLNQTKLVDPIRINDFKGLKRVQMNGNQITSLPKLNIRQLQSIQFQDNCIQDLTEFAKGQYPECTQFSVKGNQITKLPLIKMQKLRKAYFNQNQIEDIQEFLQISMPDLETLTFDYNHLKRVKNLPYPSLSDVYFTGNRELEELTCFNLPQYNQLKMIVAASTGIKKVQKLPKMLSLEKIWVNDSKLQDIKWLAQSASNLPKLSFVNVADNQIKTLPALQIKSLGNVYMSNNPFEDIESFIKMDQEYFASYGLFQLSIKCSSDEEYDEKHALLQEKMPSMYVSRFY